MKGIQSIEISNRTAKFKFDLYRNITIVRGNSGTGKTTLYTMVADYTRLGASSGVTISSIKKCVALVDIDWKNQLRNVSDSIVFIDEGSDYIVTKEFANAIKRSDNYYVIFNREALHELPYSVDEIYEIKKSGKYHSLKKMFPSKEGHIYSSVPSKNHKYSVLITEDSKSGFQFYENYFKGTSIECVSTKSNSAIFKWLKKNPDSSVLIIADGAAFGSEIDRVMKLQSRKPGMIRVCLPESFEWLILKSGMVNKNSIIKKLNNPSDYVDSAKYFSWEVFFEKLLVEETKDTPFQYQKKRINKVYLNEENSKRIVAEISKAIE